jgi:citrate lyase subunit beta/citryl-CoA lyase
MRAPTSSMYIPGDRPERLERGFERGASALIADLEDAVVEESKDGALANIVEWLGSVRDPGVEIWVRVNGGERRDREIGVLATQPALTGIVLPKAESAAEVRAAATLLDAVHSALLIDPLIESASGLVNIHEIAAVPRVNRLHLGEMDLAADLGVQPGPAGDEFLYARSLIVVASRYAGLVAPAAPVTAEIDDTDAFRASTLRLRHLGFFGRDCIHPAQVAVANEVFGATAAELAWAESILTAAALNHGAFRAADGTMVDEAILRRARSILASIGV